MDKTQDVDALAAKGRDEDSYLAHVAPGEMVVPPVISDELKARILEELAAAGLDPEEYMVGAGMGINPITGMPEFGFLKKIKKIVKSVAPVVAPLAGLIPGIGPLAAAAIGAGGGLLGGGGLKGALAGGLGAAALGGGGKLLGSALGFGTNAAGQGIGGALLGAGAGAATGGGQGALLGGVTGGLGNYYSAGGFDNLISGAGSTASGALQDIGNFTGLSDIYSSASGALSKMAGGVSDTVDSLYNGSQLQSAFKSGGDVLKSIGIGTGSEGLASEAAVGGGASSYTPAESNFLEKANTVLDKGPAVTKSANYASPLASALLGTFSNNKAEDALLKGQRANQQLLAPYANGFSFTPGDLTQDPGYKFNLDQGTKAVDRAQLARGGYFSGNAAKELGEFTQGLADNTYGSAFTRALQGNQAGLQGALANAGINENIGNIKANSATNTGNLYSGALGNILGGNSFTNTGALQGGFDLQDFLRRNGIGVSSYGR